ncbi:MAG: diguanylate cyclase [Patescibacteria group bacterium]|jgi:diguanylate cyclase (GGDEF)-like protein
MANRERGYTTDAERKALWRKPLDQKLTDARYKFERIVGTPAPKEDVESAELELKAARLDVESYDFERDSTGAWKGESLGVDLNNAFEELQNEDGDLDQEKAKSLHVVQVNMGELDRLNKVYGHETGNKALGDTCQLIYEKLEAVIGDGVKKKTGKDATWEDVEAYFDVYRSSGNDFTVLLRDVDAETAQQIQRSLNGDLPVEGVGQGEAAPLVATYAPLTDAVAYFNENQGSIGNSNPGRAFVDVVKEQGQILNDIEKNNRRIDRILKIGDEAKAKDLYDNYLKKSLGRMFVTDPSAEAMDFESFREALKQSKDEGLEKAISQAIGDFRSRQKEAHHLSATLSKFVFDKKKEELLKSQGRELKEEDVLRTQEPKVGVQAESEEIKDEKEFLGQLEPTTGEKEIESKNNEVKRLEALAAGDPENKLIAARLKLARSEQHNVEVKRKSATGLYERGMLFGEIKSRLAEGKPITVVAIDMAFLKYFDKEGGRKTGNAAIMAAARMLDAAVREVDPSLKAEAYSTGGDEFALTLETDDQEIVRKVQYRIREMAKQLPVPALDKGRSERYRSEELNFNFGVYSASDMVSFRQELTDAQFKLQADPKNKNAMVEEAADYLFRIADRQVEIEKTIQRFMFLTRRYYFENMGGEEPKGNYERLESYSAKAIGEEGPKLIRQWAGEIATQKSAGKDLDWGALQRKVLEHVIESGQQEMEKHVAEGEFTDRLLESTVRERFLKQRLEELESTIKTMRADLEKSGEDKADLKKEISELEAEIKTVGQLRKRIGDG